MGRHWKSWISWERAGLAVLFPVSQAELIDFLGKYGKTPLPPYIKPGSRDEQLDSVGYQTIFSGAPGSVAAPTAGLHFTDSLVHELSEHGVSMAKITLHVGPGTFIPVKSRDIREHRMQSESYEITGETATLLNSAKRQGRRIIAVGTTTLRTLESSVGSNGLIKPGQGESSLYIYPGYKFKFVENLITNFHLPGFDALYAGLCAGRHGTCQDSLYKGSGKRVLVLQLRRRLSDPEATDCVVIHKENPLQKGFPGPSTLVT